MLWMCETLFYTVKYVVTEIVFWVANEIVALAPKGVYAGSLINKLRYCPKSVPGDLTDWNFSYKEVGDVDLSCILELWKLPSEPW